MQQAVIDESRYMFQLYIDIQAEMGMARLAAEVEAFSMYSLMAGHAFSEWRWRVACAGGSSSGGSQSTDKRTETAYDKIKKDKKTKSVTRTLRNGQQVEIIYDVDNMNGKTEQEIVDGVMADLDKVDNSPIGASYLHNKSWIKIDISLNAEELKVAHYNDEDESGIIYGTTTNSWTNTFLGFGAGTTSDNGMESGTIYLATEFYNGEAPSRWKLFYEIDGSPGDMPFPSLYVMAHELGHKFDASYTGRYGTLFFQDERGRIFNRPWETSREQSANRFSIYILKYYYPFITNISF